MRVILLLLVCLLPLASLFAQATDSKVRDGIYDKVTTVQKQIIEYEPIREADVFWARRIWRLVDVREKMNLPFKYPKAYLVDIIRNAGIEGRITLYDELDDEFTTPILASEVASKGVGKPDTLRIMDPVTKKEVVEITNPKFDPTKVNKFRIKEEWVFDKEASRMLVRIIGIAPILDVFDEFGEYRGEKVLFWVYYPELRPVLAQEEAFNSGNGGQRLSWDDVFEGRFFSSYIIKMDNVYDRRIQDYVTSFDALYEADRIAEYIVTFEHDLWEY